MTEPLKDFAQKIVDTEVRDNDGCCLFLTMGAGKTRVAIELIKKFKAERVLVVSKSKIVKEVWHREMIKWGLDYSYLCLAGKPATYQENVMKDGIPANTVVATNFESFGRSVKTKVRPKRIWLDKSPMLYAYEEVLWDVIIIDESTCIKDPQSNVALAMLNLTYNCPNAYVMSLTGTPNPEETVDFYTQVSVVDRGKRFGESYTSWRDKYFYKPPYEYKYKPFPFGVGGKTIGEVIADLCKDLCYVVTKDDLRKNKDYNVPPRLPDKEIYFEMNDKAKHFYAQMKENVITLEDRDITAQNAAIVISKLLQISSGIVYDNEREGERLTYFFGLEKINVTLEIIKQIEGKVIVCYNFMASKTNLELYLGLNDIEYGLAEEVSEEEFENSKTLKVLLLQPKSGAYGSNYQSDCHNMIWYEGQDSGEKFLQTEARIERVGQLKRCQFWYVFGKNTYDKVARDKTRLKETTALTILNAIKGAQQEDYEDLTLLEAEYLFEDMF